MNTFFISFYDEGHRGLHNAFYQIRKKLIFHEDMSLRSWYFIRESRHPRRFLGILIYKIQNLSPPRAFKLVTRGFRHLCMYLL